MKTSSLLVAPALRVIAILFLLGAISAPLAQPQVSFFTPPTYAGNGILFEADFNGDGKPDLLSSDGTLQLGSGNGIFTTGTPVPGTPLAVADFNGDGKPDVLEQGTGTLLVLLGNGDGTFQRPISTNSGASLYAVVAGDLNGDGKADVLGLFNNNLVVYLSKGDGTFGAGVSYPVGDTSIAYEAITLGDFNGDRIVDVAVSLSADVALGREVVLLGTGDGTFQSGKTSAGVYYPRWAVAGDFNGDGKLDLAIAAQPNCNGSCVGTYNISLLLGNGDGTFQAPTPIISSNGPLAAADLNGDGKLDLVLEADATVAEIYLGNGDGTFSNPGNYTLLMPNVVGDQPSQISIADFNLDGKLDIAAGNAVLLGNGSGAFQGVQLGVVPEYPSADAVGDFDKNGTPDVAVVSNQEPHNVFILSNNGAGGLSLIHTYTLQEPGRGIVTADFNGDGNLDLVVFSTDPITQEWSYSVLLGNGDGSFQTPVFNPQNISTATQAYSIVVGDFNNDNKLDIAASLAGPGGNSSLALVLGNGDGTFAAPAYVFDGGAFFLVSADFNGDGKLDIAAGGSGMGNSATALLFGNGNGTFQPAIFPANLNNFAAQFTADVNNDGKSDLLSATQLALGNGDGTFNLLPSFCQNCVGADAVTDFNGDGILDLLITQGTQGFDHSLNGAVLLGNGDGTFGSPIAINAYLPPPTLVADMNGDGHTDIIFPWQGASFGAGVNGVGVLLNTTVPAPATKFSPDSVTFPSQMVGTNSPPAGVTLSNTGKGVLAVASVKVAGLSASEFSQTNNCTSIQPGAICTITVVFTPTTGGSAAASLAITDNAVGSPQIVALSGTAPDFSIGTASGSDSATISAGQSASFNLAVTPAGAFSGMVSLNCAITPAVTPAPVCTVPASVNVTQGTAAAATAKISTTAAGIAGSISRVNPPRGMTPIAWTIVLLASGLLFSVYRRRMPALAIPMVAVAFLAMPGCGGGGGSSASQTPGTPAGTYTATVTAKSGSLSHNTALTVIVQ